MSFKFEIRRLERIVAELGSIEDYAQLGADDPRAMDRRGRQLWVLQRTVLGLLEALRSGSFLTATTMHLADICTFGGVVLVAGKYAGVPVLVMLDTAIGGTLTVVGGVSTALLKIRGRSIERDRQRLQDVQSVIVRHSIALDLARKPKRSA